MTQHQVPELLAEHEAAVDRAIRAMRPALFRAVRLDDHAAAGMYSRYHFHRVFREVTGTTPARYLAGLRMQEAKQLLAGSDLTVTTISGLVGYESLGTFTTQFGRLVGISPGRFRQLVDELHDLTVDDVALGPWAHGPGAPGLTRPPRATFVGTFRGGLPTGVPASFTLLPDLDDTVLAAIERPERGHAPLAFSVPAGSRLTDIAVGVLDDLHVGTPSVAREGPPGLRLMLRMRPWRTVDHPLVTAAAVRLLAARRRPGTAA
ncbi:AraC family transcriptional regulator [Kineosporia sp. NBRC 101731]|uniref:helix-turn-helix domain-containing protein n=1 Tax=Kineosporia sp. NBRC 101731 TaxID=3032199 RepID=UPI0024A3D485|nr:AraC family transcriptional regulator [Kineosporia sp. NBRC 101731]GLY30376.1 hypothetical protein Kisp02_37410 [Kineosporia sp. NBRC 101731]